MIFIHLISQIHMFSLDIDCSHPTVVVNACSNSILRKQKKIGRITRVIVLFTNLQFFLSLLFTYFFLVFVKIVVIMSRCCLPSRLVTSRFVSPCRARLYSNPTLAVDFSLCRLYFCRLSWLNHLCLGR